MKNKAMFIVAIFSVNKYDHEFIESGGQISELKVHYTEFIESVVQISELKVQCTEFIESVGGLLYNNNKKKTQFSEFPKSE
jgi:hypothetical protein